MPTSDARGAGPPGRYLIEPLRLDALFGLLRQQGFEIVGPTRRDGAIVYDTLDSAADLPIGWTDRQEAGRYRLEPRSDGAWFGYAVGPHSWKRFLHPPVLRLFSARRRDGGLAIEPETDRPPRLALVGVRPCEIAGLARLDRVMAQGPFVDPAYAARRAATFILAVQCGAPSGTCFCRSMGTGPRADDGFDIALTEIVEPGRHVFVAEAGSPRGAEVLSALAATPAGQADIDAAAAVTRAAAERMGRTLETEGLRDALMARPEHPRWDEVAARCLTCGNCTMVCPTCFCTTVDDTMDLTGSRAERWRRWDSCFSVDFSYMYGGSVRLSPRSRYRQWLTHKLATWWDQFGESGCVGCGRCITWCPVGIDITSEARAICEAGDKSGPALPDQERTHGDS